jgi:hypothetical protein
MLKPAPVEVAADAGEQVGLVGRVHQHLQAFAHRRRRARTITGSCEPTWRHSMRACQAMSAASWRMK